jgi:hypothetical protein
MVAASDSTGGRFRMPKTLTLTAALAAVLMAAGCGSAGAPGDPERAAGDAPAATAPPTPAAADAGAGADEGDASALSAQSSMRLDAGSPGLPAGGGASIDDVLRLGAVATWLDAPDVVAVSLPATGECWAVTDAAAESSTRLVVAFAEAEVCEEPAPVRTYEIEVPEGIDAREGIELAITGLDESPTLELPAP